MPAMYVEGRTTPPVQDATVTVQRNNLISLQDRAPKIAKTNSNGEFKIGPVHIDSYTIDISQTGYTFERVDESTYDFIVHREALVRVIAEDSQQIPLVNVFVTLSSGKTALHGHTDEHGSLLFSELKSPLIYYLHASKKEYSFVKNTDSIQVGNQEHVLKVIIGEKMAFSAYGKVVDLIGQTVGEGVISSRLDDNIE